MLTAHSLHYTLYSIQVYKYTLYIIQCINYTVYIFTLAKHECYRIDANRSLRNGVMARYKRNMGGITFTCFGPT